MIELEKLEYPKPLRDFIYSTFNEFSAAHPWVGQENIRPKSVAREMLETFQSFADYVRDYGLQRIEGLLLRYLSDVYRVLEQTVPEAAKTDEVQAMAVYFGTMIRQTDSSLVEDWEKMLNSTPTLTQEGLPQTLTLDPKAFTRVVRNEVHRLVRALASGDLEGFMDLIEPKKPNSEEAWKIEEIDSRLKDFHLGHSRICTDPSARYPIHTHIDVGQKKWEIEQKLLDPEEHNDWFLRLSLDLDLCQNESRLSLALVSLGPLD